MSLVEDLKAVNKMIYFWNWKKETKNTVLRYNSDHLDLFKSSKEIHEILNYKYQADPKNNEIKLKNGIYYEKKGFESTRV